MQYSTTTHKKCFDCGGRGVLLRTKEGAFYIKCSNPRCCNSTRDCDCPSIAWKDWEEVN